MPIFYYNHVVKINNHVVKINNHVVILINLAMKNSFKCQRRIFL